MLAALLGAHAAVAQTVASLKIIAGDGQMPCPSIQCTLQTFQPITVQALDASGAGVKNATITWTVTPVTGGPTVGPTNATSGSSTTTTTDSTGMSTTPVYQNVIVSYGSVLQPSLPSTIVASANGGSPSATFYETYALINHSGQPMMVAYSPIMGGLPLGAVPLSGGTVTLSGLTGSTLPDIQMFIGNSSNAGVQGISVELLTVPGQTTATIACAQSSLTGNPGAVLSGPLISTSPELNVDCTPKLGGSGAGQFYLMVGGASTSWVISTAAMGTVDTNGTAVTWDSGADFTVLAAGMPIQINGVEYAVSTVTSPTALVLTSSAGVQSGVVWIGYIRPYFEQFGPYNFASNAGPPVAIKKLQGDIQAVAPGQSLGTLIAEVVDSNGNAVQNANVNWSANPAGAVVLRYTANFSTTDNNGQTSAVANFAGGAAGNAGITVSLAGNSAINATFTETALAPITGLQKISGDAQRAAAGTSFAAPLVVQVNGSNNPITNYPVQFSIAGPGILSQPSTPITNNSGQAQVTVTAGSGTGTITVTASVPGFSQTFTLTVVAPGPTPTGIVVVSGNSQSAAIGANFPAPLTVQVNSISGPVGNYAVTFSASGLVTLSSNSSPSTNSAGQAQVTVTAGSVTGAATVTASIPGYSYSVTFNLTVTPPVPTLTAASFANGASGQTGFISPCGIATITATGLDPTGAAGLFPAPVFGPLPTSMNGISVDFNNYFAPIFSATLINGQPQLMVQVPCEVTPGASVPVTVNVGAGSVLVNVPVLAAAPGCSK